VGLQRVALERRGNICQQSGKSVLTFFAEQAKTGAQWLVCGGESSMRGGFERNMQFLREAKV